MPDELESLLRLVAEGRLTPEEAAPLLAALQDRRETAGRAAAAKAGPDRRDDRDARTGPGRVQQALSNRRIRIFVADDGRPVVNLQIPLGAAGYALDRLPGLSDDYRDRISEAIRTGMTGPILEVHDGGDEVRIVIE